MSSGVPLNQVTWKPCWRVVPSRFPPINLFERVADPADLDAVFEIEALTNDRLRDETGDLRLVPERDRISGPGTSYIMAAFTHLNPLGSRFSDGTWGVYYAGQTLDTAITETRFHRANFLRATNEPPMELQMRAIAANLEGALHDLRGLRETMVEVYDPDSHAASQAFAASLRKAGSSGIVYHSVRHHGGECVGVFRPPLLSNARQERHLGYRWDGREISAIYELREYGGGP